MAQFLKLSEDEVKAKYLDEKEIFHTKLFRPKLKGDKPYGECIFFNGKGCDVHGVKPTQCRTGNCWEHGEELAHWFMLNFQVNADDFQSVREYELYLKQGGKTLPDGKVSDVVPDKERLKKIREYGDLK